MSTLSRAVSILGFVLAVAGCAAGDVATPPADSATISPVAAATPGACPTPNGNIPNVFSVPGPGDFPSLELTTYWVDPDIDPCTPLRVLYTIPAEGWLAWTGTFKEGEGPDGEVTRVGVSIVTVTNLVVDGCADHSLADPPVGPTVDDLATALAALPPFVVTSPASDVTVDGYSGKHLELAVPDMEFSECVNGELISWDAPVLSYPFHGYLPRMIEEFRILDVQGSRLVIVANRTPNAAPEDIAEMHAVFDSIQIEP
jgi:hypothetical protein